VQYVDGLIRSIIAFDGQSKISDVVFVDGGSTDGTVEKLNFYSASNPKLRIMHNAKKTVPSGLNLAINATSSKYVVRLDAHSTYPPEYILHLYEVIERTGAANVGACIMTKTKDNGIQARAIRTVLASSFGVGDSDFRIGSKEEKKVTTVPFGFFRRQSLVDAGLYDERLLRNQDIELNGRLINDGGDVILSPSTSCVYWARGTFKEFWRNNFSNGLWNIITVTLTKGRSGLTLRHFVPLLFSLSVMLLPLLGLVHSLAFYVWASIVLVYVASSLYFYTAGKIYRNSGYLGFLICHTGLHISYGFGSIVGVCRAPSLYLLKLVGKLV